MRFRFYEISLLPESEALVKQALDTVRGLLILESLENDGKIHFFCAAKSSFPEVLEGFVNANLKDITDQLGS